MIFLYLFVMICGLLFFFFGYDILKHQTKRTQHESFTGRLEERMIDSKKHMKTQGIFYLTLSGLFLGFPFFIYCIKAFNLDNRMLYLWIGVLGIVVLTYAYSVRKNLK